MPSPFREANVYLPDYLSNELSTALRHDALHLTVKQRGRGGLLQVAWATRAL
jgi:hypothetical protein